MVIIEKLALDLDKRKEEKRRREELFNKLYLSEIIDKEKPSFGTNNLILAPVGSGKSFLIENRLIPKDFKGNVLYLTSNTALKDSISPNNNKTRKKMAEKGTSVRFFTSENKNRYGDRDYDVHVMTYHEFGGRIMSPVETFTESIDLVFCDEIHSLPVYMGYGNNAELYIALKWLFQKHKGKKLYYFTATKDSLEDLDVRLPGYMGNVNVFDYIEHPKIRRYEVKSLYYIRHLIQLRTHLSAKVNYIKRSGSKGLAFTQKISEQKQIYEIAKEEGYTPIIIWSVNNDEHIMSDEQIRVRDFILTTGYIPEPYNLLIINNAMQEGWNLFDDKVEFAILNTVDKTEQVQALGRIRKDIDFIVIKSNDYKDIDETFYINDKYLNTPLTSVEKSRLAEDLNILNDRGHQVKWTSIKRILEKKGYLVEDTLPVIDGKRVRLTTISLTEFKD